MDGEYEISVRYSNDNLNNGRLETVTISVDKIPLGVFQAMDTGDGGYGWEFFETALVGTIYLQKGDHTLDIHVEGGDGYGVEIDYVELQKL